MWADEPYPIIFIHGHIADPSPGKGFETWYKEGRTVTVLEKIIYENYGGYSAGEPLNCYAGDDLQSTGGDKRKIYNFSYYWDKDRDGSVDEGAIGSNGLLTPTNPLYYSWYQNIVESRSFAEELGVFIDKVLEATGAEKVNIVAHSMGGIVARATIKYYGYKDKVNKLVLIGTPNQGLHYTTAELVANFQELFGGNTWQMRGENLELNVDPFIIWPQVIFHDISTGEEGIFCDLLGHDEEILGVETATIAGDRSKWPTIVFPWPNDGVVAASWVWLAHAKFSLQLIDADHSYDGGGPPDQILSLPSSPFTEWFIKKWVIDDEVYTNAEIVHEPFVYPSTWEQYESRIELGLGLDNPALVGVIMVQDNLGRTRLIKGAPLFRLRGLPDRPLISLAPRDMYGNLLGNDIYGVEFEIYDMFGRVPSPYNKKTKFEVRKDPQGPWDPEIIMLYPQGGEHHNNPNMTVQWKMRANQVLGFKVYCNAPLILRHI